MSGLCYCKWLGDHFATKFNTLGQTVLEIQPYLRLRFGAPAQCDAAARNAVAGLADRDADLCDRGSAFCERRLSQYDIPQWPVYIRIETACASQFTSAPFGGGADSGSRLSWTSGRLHLLWSFSSNHLYSLARKQQLTFTPLFISSQCLAILQLTSVKLVMRARMTQIQAFGLAKSNSNKVKLGPNQGEVAPIRIAYVPCNVIVNARSHWWLRLKSLWRFFIYYYYYYCLCYTITNFKFA